MIVWKILIMVAATAICSGWVSEVRAYGKQGKHDLAIADYNRYLEISYDAAWADVAKCRELGGEIDEEFLAQLKQDSGRDE